MHRIVSLDESSNIDRKLNQIEEKELEITTTEVKKRKKITKLQKQHWEEKPKTKLTIRREQKLTLRKANQREREAYRVA